MATSAFRELQYFKRYRMEAELASLEAPDLPVGYRWVPWEESLLETHALVKFRCFVGEVDGLVFPNLSHTNGCMKLMREIRKKAGFCPAATWLIARGNEFVATVQGVGDRYGCGAIQNLGVIHSERSQGLGAALLLQALDGFRRSGLHRAMLEVTAQNHLAIQLYRRFGFRFRRTIYKVVEPSVEAPFDPDWLI